MQDIALAQVRKAFEANPIGALDAHRAVHAKRYSERHQELFRLTPIQIAGQRSFFVCPKHAGADGTQLQGTMRSCRKRVSNRTNIPSLSTTS